MTWDSESQCGCGETPPTIAVISRTISKYRHVPTIEIEQNISWLGEVKKDCDQKIKCLEQLKIERRRSQVWRDDLNAIARQFYDTEALDYDLDMRAAIIKQRLGCDDKRAYALAVLVNKWAKNERRKQRDEQIKYAHGIGFSAIKIAEQHGISRQQVHNIIKKNSIEFVKKRSLFGAS